MMVFSLTMYYFLKNDNLLTQVEGVTLLIALVIFLVVLIRSAKNEDVNVDELAATVLGIPFLRRVRTRWMVDVDFLIEVFGAGALHCL